MSIQIAAKVMDTTDVAMVTANASPYSGRPLSSLAACGMAVVMAAVA